MRFHGYMLVIAVATVTLVGCGKNSNTTILPAASSSGPGYLNLQGYHVLPDGGYADIVSDTGNLQDVVSLRLMVKNADGSTGMIPLASVLNLPTAGDKIYYTQSITYAALNNVRADVGNAQLTTAHTTFFTLSRVSGRLNIRVQISSPTAVVFDHTIVEE